MLVEGVTWTLQLFCCGTFSCIKVKRQCRLVQREETISGVSQMVKSENGSNKCNVGNTLDMICFCFHKSPVANWAKGKTGSSAGAKVLMNILLLGDGIYIKESICWAGSHTCFSFIPTCFYCELLVQRDGLLQRLLNALTR